eukprot:11088378-Alexandrium_andersonii.AAC.1
MSPPILGGPARWRPAPDSATWTFRHKRPESASPRSRTEALAGSGAPQPGPASLRQCAPEPRLCTQPRRAA